MEHTRTHPPRSQDGATASKDSSCQVLSPSRGFGEAQGRIRGDIGDRHITHNCVSSGVRSCAAKDIDLELFEITYVQCGDVEVEKKIDEKIEQFISRVEKHSNKKSLVAIRLDLEKLLSCTQLHKVIYRRNVCELDLVFNFEKLNMVLEAFSI
ncbi:hypothetical protein Q3G72_015208 [Acer saccharum]|nr:hypothetical protein Q3G72_015208 [Acer saccharum]